MSIASRLDSSEFDYCPIFDMEEPISCRRDLGLRCDLKFSDSRETVVAGETDNIRGELESRPEQGVDKAESGSMDQSPLRLAAPSLADGCLEDSFSEDGDGTGASEDEEGYRTRLRLRNRQDWRLSNRSDLSEMTLQVGGHKVLKMFGKQYVCKPYDRREYMFYHTAPLLLAPFLPRYGGVATVSSCDDIEDYIILENLTSGYEKPCILDLKMGTRMYGDFASQQKRISQDNKTRFSTSGSLGIRLCGYQRYDEAGGGFQRVDKYVGRRLDNASLMDMLRSFFTIGQVRQNDVILQLKQQAEDLQSIVKQLDSYRFYSSSLLILFDGESRPPLDPVGERNRQSQRSASITSSSSTVDSCEEDDLSCNPSPLTSSSSMSTASQNCNSDCPSCRRDLAASPGLSNCSPYCRSNMCCQCRLSSPSTAATTTSGDLNENDIQKEEDDLQACCSRPIDNQEQRRTLPKLRLIDFANVTCPSLTRPDDPKHEGPDHGLLFGLTNFISILNTFLMDNNRSDQDIRSRE